MGLKAKDNGGGDYTPVTEGTHLATCYAVYDLGTHYSDLYQNSNRAVMICWEVPEERIEIDGNDLPRGISRRYTLSLHKKANLRKDLEAWRGRAFHDEELKDGFDIEKLLGVGCMVSVVHKQNGDKMYANVISVTAIPKGVSKPKLENPKKFFSFDDGNVIPDDTPEWIEKIIQQSNEWKALHNGDGAPQQNAPVESQPPVVMDDDDDIPF